MAARRIPAEAGRASVSDFLAGSRDRTSTATAVRFLLQVLADGAPGNTVEVRVPPFGAVQVIEGPRHTRGTPPNVVELDAETWVGLATGSIQWDSALRHARVTASGQRADLSAQLPVAWETMDS